MEVKTNFLLHNFSPFCPPLRSLVMPCFMAVVVGSFVSWLWWYRWVQRRIPGPDGWPLVGCMFEVAINWGRLHDYILQQFQTTKTFCLPFHCFATDVYTVDPMCVEYILKTNFSNYPKGHVNCEPFQELLGDGIFTADGEKWKEQRRVASYEFSSAALRECSTNVFREYALKLVFILVHNARTTMHLDLQDLCMRMTLDTTCKIGFGMELGCLSPSLPNIPFAKCFDDANYICYFRYADPFWKIKRLLNIGHERRLKECIKVLDGFAYTVIEKKLEEMGLATQKAIRSDLLSRFTDLSKQVGERYTDKALRDMILNFIIAGRDTTAITLSWFFYMLTCHPNVAERIVEEISFIHQEPSYDTEGSMEEEKFVRFADLLTYETLGKLPYLHAALSETLRLFPPVPVDSKQAVADDVLPDGTRVGKGYIVGYVPYSMGRMKFLWGDDALEFKPERWLKSGHLSQESPFKFTAFQAGPRSCLGKESAYLQMKMTVALVLRFFTVHLVPGHPVNYRTMLVLTMLHGLQVTVMPRS